MYNGHSVNTGKTFSLDEVKAEKIIQSSSPLILGQCRNLRFTSSPIHGYRLENHTIRTTDVINEHLCEMQCFLEPNCVSYNFHKTKQESGKHKCDLNNATFHHENPGDLKKNKNYLYRGAEVSIKLRGLKLVIATFFLNITGFGFLRHIKRHYNYIFKNPLDALQVHHNYAQHFGRLIPQLTH